MLIACDLCETNDWSCISCYPLQSGSTKEGFLEFTYLMRIFKFEMNVFFAW